MSASREKKQRQDPAMATVMTEKERKERAAAQKAKTKKVIYWMIGIVCAVAVVALLVWNSGFFQSREAAVTVAGKSYTVNDVGFYYGNLVSNAANMSASLSDTSQASLYESMGWKPFYDASKQPWEQTITEENLTTMTALGFADAEAGMNWDDYFKSQALENLRQDVMLCDQAAIEGYTLSQEGQRQVESTFKSYETAAKNYGFGSVQAFLRDPQMHFGKYMTPGAFKDRLTASVLASEFADYKSEEGERTEEELTAYYEEHKNELNCIDYRTAYITTLVTTTDAEGNTVDPTDAEKAAALALAKVEADAMVKEVKGGMAFNESAQNHVAETSRAQYADPDYNKVTGRVGSNLTALSFGEWLTDSARKANDVTAVEDANGSGYYVVQFLDSYLDEETVYSAEVRHILVMAETDEAVTNEDGTTTTPEPTEEQYAAAKAKIEEIKAEFEAGEQTAEAFGALADKYSEDPGSNGSSMDNGGSSGGYYEVFQYTSFFDDFKNWCLDPDRQSGDLEIIQNTQTNQWGYHLMYFQSQGLPVWKHTAQAALNKADYDSWYEATDPTYVAEAVEAGLAKVGR